jgi:hypothetical protein
MRSPENVVTLLTSMPDFPAVIAPLLLILPENVEIL